VTLIQPTNTPTADIGDFMKVAACTAVILQTVLALVLSTQPSLQVQRGIGLTYNVVKFTAPAFIFGIFYTTNRQTYPSQLTAYPQYLLQQWSALFFPTIGWTLVYLLAMPNLQQHRPYHDALSFSWQFITGNAAPHLWYNTMMLQFIILMPLFWYMFRQLTRPRIIWLTLSLLTVSYLAWLAWYDVAVWHGPQAHTWYLLDRLFISFLPYAILGGLTWQYRATVMPWLQHWHWWLVGAYLLSLISINWEFAQFGTPVKLSNAPYYQPSMTIYALLVIGLIAWLATHQLQRQAASLPLIHWLATYAYRAYLANVFWLQVFWTWMAPTFSQRPIWLISLTYLLTWLASFATAFGLHWGWSMLKQPLENSHKQ